MIEAIAREPVRPVFDFLVIGAQKCGTTWLHDLLDQHPQIAVPTEKELHFFNHRPNLEKGVDWYASRINRTSRHALAGECTPNYFWNTLLAGEPQSANHVTDIATQVKAINPQARLIVALRDPVARAVSAYYHHIGKGRIDPRTSILDNLDRFGIRSMGLYVNGYDHWTAQFDPSQLLVLVFERDIADKARNPETIRTVLEHIGAPPFDGMDGQSSKNQRNSYFSMWSSPYIAPQSVPGRVVRKLSNLLLPRSIDDRFRPRVTEDERATLREYYRPYNRQLGERIGQDLEAWWG